MNENDLHFRDMVKNPKVWFFIATVIFIVSIFVPWFYMQMPTFWIGELYTDWEHDFLWSFMEARLKPQEPPVELWFMPLNTEPGDWRVGNDQGLDAIYIRIGWFSFQILTAVSAIVALFAGIKWKRIVPIVALSSITLTLATYYKIMLTEVFRRAHINYSFGFGLAIVSTLMFFISCYRLYTLESSNFDR